MPPTKEPIYVYVVVLDLGDGPFTGMVSAKDLLQAFRTVADHWGRSAKVLNMRRSVRVS
jgi:hypothetical protein